MSMWLAVLAACALAFALKLAGYLVPQHVLEIPWVHRVTPLLPVALLSALIVTQAVLTGDGTLVLDARAAGVGVGVLLLVLRAPFLVVVAAAAVTAALVRAVL